MLSCQICLQTKGVMWLGGGANGCDDCGNGGSTKKPIYTHPCCPRYFELLQVNGNGACESLDALDQHIQIDFMSPARVCRICSLVNSTCSNC